MPRFFAPLRFTQNDSIGDERTDVTLSSAIEPLKAFTRRRPGERPLTVILSPFAQFTLSEANGLRVDSAKHLALLLVGAKLQSEILRSAALRSE